MSVPVRKNAPKIVAEIRYGGRKIGSLSIVLGAELEATYSLRKWEKRAIVAALQASNGSKAKASRLLEIPERTLYRKVARYDLEHLCQHWIPGFMKIEAAAKEKR